MSLISVRNLTFSYDGGASDVFNGVNFQIDTDWKLGFIGRNGRGKTTFLNLLLGKYRYSGTITAGVKFTYFPYRPEDEAQIAYDIVKGVCPLAEDWEILRELSLLNIDAEKLYSEFSALSEGEKTKILLAGLFLNDGNFLLIDEPTNHLDAESRLQVAQYLNRKKGFILVSHDRLFLDGCVDHILSINKTNIEVQSGNFSTWYENFKNKEQFEKTQTEKLQREITRLKSTAQRASDRADALEKEKNGKTSSGLKPDKGYMGRKAAKVMKGARIADDRRAAAAEEKSGLLKNTETEEKLKINPLDYHSERLATFNGVGIYYGDRRVCEPVSFEILRGERVALCGANGCGKSSILKLIAGKGCEKAAYGKTAGKEENALNYSGFFKLGSGLKISYIPQTAAGLEGTFTEFIQTNGLEAPLFYAVLQKTGFEKAEFSGDIKNLSDGQKKKILLAKSLCEKAHLYVWDEPLNYLDFYARMQLENLLREFAPTLIFVEHDGAFLKNVATKTVDMVKVR